MLGPGDIQEDRQSLVVRQVEEPLRGYVIRPDRIDPDVRHPGKVLGHAPRRGERFAGRVGREGSVGHALDSKSPPRAIEKLTIDTGPSPRTRTFLGLLVVHIGAGDG